MVVVPPPSRSPTRDTGAAVDVLRVANLGVRLDHVPILEDVSFHVRRGTTLAIVGPNGAGKPPLFRALLGGLPHRGWVDGPGRGRPGDARRDLVATIVPIGVRDGVGSDDRA